MDSYSLSRNFWDWAFENPEKVSPNHAAIYFFAIEHCNRLGWKKKFGFPSQMTMEAIGIKKHSTYIKYFQELVEWGFFVLVEKSKNQYSANIISLNDAMPKNGKALDKANVKHGAKQSESIWQSTGSINKQINKETKKPFIPPTLFEVVEYFSANGYTVESANKAYEYYHVANWTDSKGNKVKNWKQKMQGVWFKDENKQKSNIRPMVY